MFEDVTDTALWVAAYRARESVRPDALFRDLFADRLSGERGKELARKVDGSANFEWSIVVRTRVIDDLLRDAIGAGVDTVVNLGAGMDARPYRLDLPSTLQWIEVDAPRILALKEERLPVGGARCRLSRVALDLSDAAARRTFLGGLRGDHAVVLTEGVIAYLENAAVTELARDLRACTPVRRWIADYTSPMLRRAMRKRRRFRRDFRRAPFRFDPADWNRHFEEEGWRIASMHYLVEAGEVLGRPVPLPLRLRILKPLLPRRMKDEMRRMMGHAVLLPA